MRLFFGGHCTFCCLSPPTLCHLAWCSRTSQSEVARLRKCPLHLSVKKKCRCVHFFGLHCEKTKGIDMCSYQNTNYTFPRCE